MRILHISTGLDPRTGGPGVALIGLSMAQVRAGLDVSILVAWSQGSDSSSMHRLQEAGIRIIRVGPVTGRLQRHPDMPRLMAEAVANADVIHIHALWSEVQHQAAVTAQRMGKPYVITPHGMLDPWSLKQSWLQKRLYLIWRLRKNLNHAATIHYTCQRECDLVKVLNLRAPSLVETLGLDLSEFDSLPPQGAFRAKFPQIGDRPIILFLSRLHYKKGLDLLVPAFAKARLRDAVLVIAGPDSDGYQAKISAMAEAHGVAGRVVFTGMLRGPERLAAYVDAELFVLPSYQENFGIVVIESIACGTPVIISDQVNIYQEILQGQVGCVVQTQVEQLTHELKRWHEDSRLREAAKIRCRPFIQQGYDWYVIAKRWVDHYARIASRNTASSTQSTSL